MSLYLHPLHGRLDPTQDMNDWGFNGPVLGPLVGVGWVEQARSRGIPADVMKRLPDGSLTTES